jgi:hypothetical protein
MGTGSGVIEFADPGSVTLTVLIFARVNLQRYEPKVTMQSSLVKASPPSNGTGTTRSNTPGSQIIWIGQLAIRM